MLQNELLATNIMKTCIGMLLYSLIPEMCGNRVENWCLGLS